MTVSTVTIYISIYKINRIYNLELNTYRSHHVQQCHVIWLVSVDIYKTHQLTLCTYSSGCQTVGVTMWRFGNKCDKVVSFLESWNCEIGHTGVSWCICKHQDALWAYIENSCSPLVPTVNCNISDLSPAFHSLSFSSLNFLSSVCHFLKDKEMKCSKKMLRMKRENNRHGVSHPLFCY